MDAFTNGSRQELGSTENVPPVMHRLLARHVSPVDLVTDPTQLSLTASTWELDDATRQIGRQGIAAARAALAAARLAPHQ